VLKLLLYGRKIELRREGAQTLIIKICQRSEETTGWAIEDNACVDILTSFDTGHNPDDSIII